LSLKKCAPRAHFQRFVSCLGISNPLKLQLLSLGTP